MHSEEGQNQNFEGDPQLMNSWVKMRVNRYNKKQNIVSVGQYPVYVATSMYDQDPRIYCSPGKPIRLQRPFTASQVLVPRTPVTPKTIGRYKGRPVSGTPSSARQDGADGEEGQAEGSIFLTSMFDSSHHNEEAASPRVGLTSPRTYKRSESSPAQAVPTSETWSRTGRGYMDKYFANRKENFKSAGRLRSLFKTDATGAPLHQHSHNDILPSPVTVKNSGRKHLKKGGNLHRSQRKSQVRQNMGGEGAWKSAFHSRATKGGMRTRDLMELISKAPKIEDEQLESRLDELRKNPAQRQEFMDSVADKMKASLDHGAHLARMNKRRAKMTPEQKARFQMVKNERRKQREEQAQDQKIKLMEDRRNMVAGNLARWEARTLAHKQRYERIERQKLQLGYAHLVLSVLSWAKRLEEGRLHTEMFKIQNAAAFIVTRCLRRRLAMRTWMRLKTAAPIVKKFLFHFRLRQAIKKQRILNQRRKEACDLLKKFLHDYHGSGLKKPIHEFLKKIKRCQRFFREWRLATEWRINLLMLYFDQEMIFMDRLRRRAHLEKLENLKRQDLKEVLEEMSDISADLLSVRNHDERKALERKKEEVMETLKVVHKVYNEAAAVTRRKANRRVRDIPIGLKRELCEDMLRDIRKKLESKRREKRHENLEKKKQPKINEEGGMSTEQIRKTLFSDDAHLIKQQSQQLMQSVLDNIQAEKDLMNSKAHPVNVLTNTSKDAICLSIILAERLACCKEEDVNESGFVRLGTLKKCFVKYAPPFYTEDDSLNELRALLKRTAKDAHSIFDQPETMINYDDVLILQSRNKILSCLLDGLQGPDAHMFSPTQRKRRSQNSRHGTPGIQGLAYEAAREEFHVHGPEQLADRYVADHFYGWKV